MLGKPRQPEPSRRASEPESKAEPQQRVSEAVPIVPTRRPEPIRQQPEFSEPNLNLSQRNLKEQEQPNRLELRQLRQSDARQLPNLRQPILTRQPDLVRPDVRDLRQPNVRDIKIEEAKQPLSLIGLIPQINLVCLESEQISITLQVNAPIDRKQFSWIKDQDVKNLLRLRTIIGFNTTKSALSIDDVMNLQSSNDYIVIDESLKLDNNQQPIQIDNKRYISDTISIVSPINVKTTINDLCLFVVVYLDNQKIAEKFKISPSTVKDDFATFIYHELIRDNKIVNKKLQRIDIITNVINKNLLLTTTIENEEIVLNSSFSENQDLQTQITSFSSVKTQFKNEVIVSELLSTANDKNMASFVFFVNLASLFKKNSKYKQFFLNNSFFNDYFQNIGNNRPENIKIYRYNKLKEASLILDVNYQPIIDDKICNIREIYTTDPTVLCISFTDKEFLNKSTYEIVLDFQDRTVQYVSAIRKRIQSSVNNLMQIINLAHLGNFYNFNLKRFDERFFIRLNQEKLSITDLVIDLQNILLKLISNPSSEISQLIQIANSKNFNIQYLEMLHNLYGFLLSEITRLENNSLKTSSSVITIKKYFNDQISFNPEINIDIFPYNKREILQLTLKEFQERINNELLKFYSTANIQVPNKISYFSPVRISTRETKVDISKISEINFDEYNSLVIDYLYSMNAVHLKVPDLQKLESVFQERGIDIKDVQELIELSKQRSRISPSAKQPERLKDLLNNEDFVNIFNILLLSFIFPDGLKQYSLFDSKSNKFKLSEKILNILPLQLRYLYDALNDNQFINRNLTIDELSEPLKASAFYLNLRNIYEIQYLDISRFNQFVWKPLVEFPRVETICRIISYKNFEMPNKFDFLINNQIFVLKP